MQKRKDKCKWNPFKRKQHMIAQLEEENKNMAQAQTESATLIQEEITTQSVEALTGKVTQVKERGRELARQVPQPGRGCSGSTHYLGGSG
jgi:hypothetical protein